MNELIKALEFSPSIFNDPPKYQCVRGRITRLISRYSRELMREDWSEFDGITDQELIIAIGYRAGKEAMRERVEALEAALRHIESAKPLFAYVANSNLDGTPKWDLPGSPYDRGVKAAYDCLSAIARSALSMAQPAPNEPDSIEQPLETKELYSTPRATKDDPTLHGARCICEECIIAREAKKADEYFNSPEPNWQEFTPSPDNPVRVGDEINVGGGWHKVGVYAIGRESLVTSSLLNLPIEIYRRQVTNQEDK